MAGWPPTTRSANEQASQAIGDPADLQDHAAIFSGRLGGPITPTAKARVFGRQQTLSALLSRVSPT